MSNIRNQLFFIAGCQRSGTTLLRLMLNSHDSINCLDELCSYDMLRNGQFEKKDKGEGVIMGFKIPRWGDYLDADKIPNMLHCQGANQFYGGEPVLFLVRDPRDVIASMMTLKFEQKTWLELYGVDDLRRKLDFLGEGAEDYNEEIAYINKTKSLAGCGALLWKIKTQSLLRYQKLGFPVMAVEYEDLVFKPERTMQLVLDQVGCVWDSSVLSHHKKQHRGTDNAGLAIGGTDPRKPVSNISVGRWKQILSEQDEDVIRTIIGDWRKPAGFYS